MHVCIVPYMYYIKNTYVCACRPVVIYIINLVVLSRPCGLSGKTPPQPKQTGGAASAATSAETASATGKEKPSPVLFFL